MPTGFFFVILVPKKLSYPSVQYFSKFSKCNLFFFSFQSTVWLLRLSRECRQRKNTHSKPSSRTWITSMCQKPIADVRWVEGGLLYQLSSGGGKETSPPLSHFYCFLYCAFLSWALTFTRTSVNSAIVARSFLVTYILCEEAARGLSSLKKMHGLFSLRICTWKFPAETCFTSYIYSIPWFSACFLICRLIPCSRKQPHRLMNAAQPAFSSQGCAPKAATASSSLTCTSSLSLLQKRPHCQTLILWMWQI